MTNTVIITGTEANQYTANSTSLSPFSGVVVSDSNPGQIETVTVNVLPGAHGVLSNLGIGSYHAATGVYTVVGTAAEVTAALDDLVFTPTTANKPLKTTFGINVIDSARDTAFDTTTTVTSAHPLTIATNGVTTLASLANTYIVENISGSVVAVLKFDGSPVTAGEFPAGWTPVAAKQTGIGYEVALGNGLGEYVVWNTDGNGNYTSSATGIVAGGTAALEANFGELGNNGKFWTARRRQRRRARLRPTARRSWIGLGTFSIESRQRGDRTAA
jgi:hypothetical protein